MAKIIIGVVIGAVLCVAVPKAATLASDFWTWLKGKV